MVGGKLSADNIVIVYNRRIENDDDIDFLECRIMKDRGLDNCKIYNYIAMRLTKKPQ
jgi:hypothetical protein